jgi:hypothetical protein
MIYQPANTSDPIRQGDIFRRVPRVDLSLTTFAMIDENNTARKTTWLEAVDEADDSLVFPAVLPVKAVDAIVITQNCDAVRGEALSLCQIDDFLQATGKTEAPKTAKKWQSLITQHCRMNLRWFYLPADEAIGFAQPMAADFRLILRLPRPELDGLRELRVARLNDLAAAHFRETLAQFFRRYAYDEWYPLTKEQFAAYADNSHEPVQPYPWQK